MIGAGGEKEEWGREGVRSRSGDNRNHVTYVGPEKNVPCNVTLEGWGTVLSRSGEVQWER